jgi:hypothetical protein
VVAVRFLAARGWRPGRPSRAATSVLVEEAYAIAALRMPWGNCGSGTARSPAGAVATPPVVASRCEATRTARRRSIRACRERWPERRRHRGVEGPAASAWTGAGASAPGVAGMGPGPVDRHGCSSSRLVMRMR